jgi:3-hydroxyacyl-CoA dehydrogenase
MKPEDIHNVAVIGLGRMGHGIAQTFAVAGYTVRGYDNHDGARASLHDRVRKNLEDFAAHDMLHEDVDAVLARISVSDTEATAVADAQFVVEAIAEDLTVKQEYFARIESCVAEDTILATNSSTYTVSMSCVNMRTPQRAIVTHWFNPPHIVPTVEMVPGPGTTEEVTATTMALHRKIGKLAVRVNSEIPGFLVNRVQNAMIREVWDLYEKGVASAEDIDAALKGSMGFRLAAFGPLAICDFGGIDIWSKVFEGLGPDICARTDVPKAVKDLLADGHVGTRTGRGFHTYESVAETESQRDDIILKLKKLLDDKGE